MTELLSVALICAGTLLAQDCSRDTALDVIVAPAHTPMECLMHAQAMAAQAGGIEFPDLVERIVELAVERYG